MSLLLLICTCRSCFFFFFFCLGLLYVFFFFFFFFFSSRRRHTRLQGDWSSDVCSSDLVLSFYLWPNGLFIRLSVVWVFLKQFIVNTCDSICCRANNYLTLLFLDNCSSSSPGFVFFQIGRASCRERV